MGLRGAASLFGSRGTSGAQARELNADAALAAGELSAEGARSAELELAGALVGLVTAQTGDAHTTDASCLRGGGAGSCAEARAAEVARCLQVWAEPAWVTESAREN